MARPIRPRSNRPQIKFRWALAAVAALSACILSLRGWTRREPSPRAPSVASAQAAKTVAAPAAPATPARARRSAAASATSSSTSSGPTATAGDADDVETIEMEDDEEDAKHAADREKVMIGVRGVLPQMKQCYEDALRKDPKIGGSVVLELTLRGKDGKGVVASAEVAMGDEGGTVNSPLLEQCLLNAVASAAFPAPSSEELYITYPFTLVPGVEADDSDDSDELDDDDKRTTSLHTIRSDRG